MATDKWTEISRRDRGVAERGNTTGAFGALADPGGDNVAATEIHRSVSSVIAFHARVAETGGNTVQISLLGVDTSRQTYLVVDFYVIVAAGGVVTDTVRLQRKPSGSAVNLAPVIALDGGDGQILRNEGTTGHVGMLTEEITGSDILQMEVVLADSTNHDVEFYGVVTLVPIKGAGVL